MLNKLGTKFGVNHAVTHMISTLELVDTSAQLRPYPVVQTLLRLMGTVGEPEADAHRTVLPWPSSHWSNRPVRLPPASRSIKADVFDTPP